MLSKARGSILNTMHITHYIACASKVQLAPVVLVQLPSLAGAGWLPEFGAHLTHTDNSAQDASGCQHHGVPAGEVDQPVLVHGVVCRATHAMRVYPVRGHGMVAADLSHCPGGAKHAPLHLLRTCTRQLWWLSAAGNLATASC